MINKLQIRTALKLVKPYIPQLQQQAAPFIENTLADIIKKGEDELQLGEDYSAITIVRQAGKVYVCLATFSEDNKWQRTLERQTTDELTNMLLNSLTNINNEL